ncbi:hypothetical protein BDV35DRAFT_373283 [Aspergillus flavus]|uniref:Uncharacterized protein n=1 Tax=Aspergillus flavus TaxID=5059 RepID=A0A5N6GH78_ASPFL|nr:hypothetical protein BDV35DRAFT_373283 [Aspergillus flavus]
MQPAIIGEFQKLAIQEKEHSSSNSPNAIVSRPSIISHNHAVDLLCTGNSGTCNVRLITCVQL